MKKRERNFLLVVIVMLLLVFFRDVDALLFGEVSPEKQLFNPRFGVLGITYNLRVIMVMLFGFLMGRSSPRILVRTSPLIKYAMFIVLLLLSNIYLVGAFIRLPNTIMSILMNPLNDRSTIIILMIFTGYYLGSIVGKDR